MSSCLQQSHANLKCYKTDFLPLQLGILRFAIKVHLVVGDKRRQNKTITEEKINRKGNIYMCLLFYDKENNITAIR